jgi:hypothetical protein
VALPRTSGVSKRPRLCENSALGKMGHTVRGRWMNGFIAGAQRNQVTLFPETPEDYVAGTARRASTMSSWMNWIRGV